MSSKFSKKLTTNLINLGYNQRMENFFENKTNTEVIKIIEDFYRAEAKDVINAVSHDIKNPLGIIDLSLGLLEDKLSTLLENAEPELKKKIEKFIGNINHGIERCQVILDNTLILRGSENTEVDTLEMKSFFENFSIYAKPSFKRAKISVTNDIDETIELRINIQLAAIAMISFLKLTTDSIIPNSSLSMKVTFENGHLVLNIASVSGENIFRHTEMADSYKYLKSKSDLIFSKLSSKYTIEEVSTNELRASLLWPNF